MIERYLLVPPELPRRALVDAARAAGGWFSAELQRTYSGVAVQQWTICEEPPLAIELNEYHVFDTRVWHLRGISAADLDQLETKLPITPNDEIYVWLADD